MWSRKMAKPKLLKTPELKSLPPTTEAFEQNLRRVHFQTAIWKSANEPDPPQLDPTEYSWTRDEASKLIPIMVPSVVKMAPPEVLELIRCGCSSSNPCSTARCSCQLPNCPAYCSVPAIEKQFVGIKTTHNLMILIVVIMMMIL